MNLVNRIYCTERDVFIIQTLARQNSINDIEIIHGKGALNSIENVNTGVYRYEFSQYYKKLLFVMQGYQFDTTQMRHVQFSHESDSIPIENNQAPQKMVYINTYTLATKVPINYDNGVIFPVTFYLQK